MLKYSNPRASRQRGVHDRTGLRERKSGFTLIELMISLSLMALLLVTLWSFFSIYQKTFEGSANRITESQIVRSLQDQLRFDLAHVPPYSETSTSPSTLTSATDQTLDGQSESETLGTQSGSTNGSTAESAASSDSSLTGFPQSGADQPNSFFGAPQSQRGSDSGSDSIPFGDVVFEITQGKWMDQEVRFFGNAYGMVIERFRVPAQRVEQHDFQTESIDDLKRIRPPDLTDRVVYAFLEPLEANRQGIPGGLFRIEIRNSQLPWINEYAQSDLYALLETVHPELFAGLLAEGEVETDDPLSDFDLRLQVMDQKSRDDANRQRADRVSHLTNQVDYIPEIMKLRFRYYDGQQWQDRWDSDAKKQLPIAIEFGFVVDLEYESKMAKLNAQQGDQSQEEAAIEIDEETEDPKRIRLDALDLDDDIRSAQTLGMKIPNRFLICIRPPSPSADMTDDLLEGETDTSVTDTESGADDTRSTRQGDADAGPLISKTDETASSFLSS